MWNESLYAPFAAAMRRSFGEWEDFRAVLGCALRRAAGGEVALAQMRDKTLWLVIVRGGEETGGEELLSLNAPEEGVSEELIALRIDVIDWRLCARRYEAVNGEGSP